MAMKPLGDKTRIDESSAAFANLIAEPIIILNGEGKVIAANNFVERVHTVILPLQPNLKPEVKEFG